MKLHGTAATPRCNDVTTAILQQQLTKTIAIGCMKGKKLCKLLLLVMSRIVFMTQLFEVCKQFDWNNRAQDYTLRVRLHCNLRKGPPLYSDHLSKASAFDRNKTSCPWSYMLSDPL